MWFDVNHFTSQILSFLPIRWRGSQCWLDQFLRAVRDWSKTAVWKCFKLHSTIQMQGHFYYTGTGCWKRQNLKALFDLNKQLLYCPWGLIIRLPTFSNIYRFIYVVRFRTYWNIMSWSEVWRNSSIFINTHYADFKSMLLMQIFRGGKCPVIPVNHQCHWVMASLPYRESPVCGYTWVVKTHPLSFPTTWATSILFPNDLGDEREGINKQTNKQTKKNVAALVVVQSLSHVFSLWPHGLQHTRLPCSSVFSRVCSNLCPISQWCYLTISSSTAPFSVCIQSFVASESFPRWVSSSHQLAKVLEL